MKRTYSLTCPYCGTISKVRLKRWPFPRQSSVKCGQCKRIVTYSLPLYLFFVRVFAVGLVIGGCAAFGLIETHPFRDMISAGMIAAGIFIYFIGNRVSLTIYR